MIPLEVRSRGIQNLTAAAVTALLEAVQAEEDEEEEVPAAGPGGSCSTPPC